jgi:hypothetical protein
LINGAIRSTGGYSFEIEVRQCHQHEADMSRRSKG